LNGITPLAIMLKILQQDPILYFRIVVIIIISITCHELAHGIAAIAQGDDTPQKSGHMTPNPLVHMGGLSLIMLFLTGMSWGQMPVNPSKFRHPVWSNVIVSFAGPLSNIIFGMIFILLLKLNFEHPTFFSNEFLYLFARINISLFLLNMLPIPPLDGFYVFSEFFPKLKSFENSPFGSLALILILVGGFAATLGTISELFICTGLRSSFSECWQIVLR
jgi:Zn-dependent protease